MKKTKIIKILGMGAMSLLLTMISYFGYSQACSGNIVNVTTSNVTTGANFVEFDVNIQNTGTTTLRLSALTVGVNLVPTGVGTLTQMMNGATGGTVTIINQPSASDFTAANGGGVANNNLGAQQFQNVAAQKQIRSNGSLTSAVTGASADNLPPNLVKKWSRLRLTLTGANFPANFPINLVISTSTANGGSQSQANVYCNGNTTSATALTHTTNPAATMTATSTAVTLNPVASGPSASVLSGGATICSGGSTNLSVAVTGGTSPYTVVVSDGGSNTYTATSASPVSIPVSAAGTYTIVSVTDNGNNVGTGNTGSAVVAVTTSAVPTAAGTYSATFNHADGLTNLYIDNSCNIIANVQDAVGGNVLGSTSVSADKTTSILIANNNLGYVPRVYTITPSSNGSATVTLYYTQADFNAYNASNGTQLDIASNPADATGIGNIRLRVATGGNINTGTLTTLTPSVSWNAGLSRWQVTATLSAMGMIYLYGEPTCPIIITGLTASTVGNNTATINWDASGATSWSFRFKPSSAVNWTNSAEVTNSRNLVGLLSNTSYDVQVRAICGPGSFGAFSNFTFTTTGFTCIAPLNLASSAVTETSATINWDIAPGVTEYTFRFKPATSPTWNNSISSSTTRFLSGLQPNTAYDVEVRSNCGGAASTFSAHQFTTLANTCTAPANVNHTGLTMNSVTIVWDAVASATNYTIRFKPSTSAIWNNTIATTNSRLFVGLMPNTSYDFEVRSNCPGFSSIFSAHQVMTGANTCMVPTNLATATPTTNSILVTWDAVATATAYAIRFKQSNASTWLNTTSMTNSRMLVGLTSGMTYNVQVRSICGQDGSVFGDTLTFTLGGVSKADQSITASMFNFGGEKTASGNVLTWTTLSEQNNKSFVIEHSTDGLSYNTLAIVASSAMNGNSEETINYSYVDATPSATLNYYRLQAVGIDNQTAIHANVVKLDNSVSHTVSIYPNPTRSQITLEFATDRMVTTKVKVMDMTGRLVKTIDAAPQSGDQQMNISLAEFSAGMYTVQVYTDGQLTHIAKVQKQD